MKRGVATPNAHHPLFGNAPSYVKLAWFPDDQICIIGGRSWSGVTAFLLFQSESDSRVGNAHARGVGEQGEKLVMQNTCV